jgi:hypothetical protein
VSCKCILCAYWTGKENSSWNRAIGLVKVQWTWYGPKDVTWEHEDAMRAEYPHLFEDFGNLVDTV